MRSVFFLCAIALLLASVAVAQTAPTSKADVERALAGVAESSSAGRLLATQGVAAFPCEAETADVAVQRACYNARRAYYDYFTTALVNRQGVYSWNDISTRVIFVVVILLVATGVYFSWMQFFGYVRPVAATSAPVSALATAAGSTAVAPRDTFDLSSEVDISLKGVRVKSPVLGVILLVVSLAFFYLYLVFVYPVSERF